MPAISASAPGKVILFGEHAVVYGQPAIAVPVNQVEAKAIITPDPISPPAKIHITAPQIDLESDYADLAADSPLAAAIRGTLNALTISAPPAFKLRITSTIPVASGLGSGAAVSVAVIRAVSSFLGHPLPDHEVSALAFEVEKLLHGTPSGIDNTVITYNKAVYYIKGKPIETISITKPFTLLIADTGKSAPTKETVADVRSAWEAAPEKYEQIFTSIRKFVEAARDAIVSGNNDALGPLMNDNHELLQNIGVSSPELDRLVSAARDAGALGAKLSGGGRGGNIIALASQERADEIKTALAVAGAKSVFTTIVK